ncbi:MAG: phosphoribosyltransferase family protein [Chloroflexota bacterium]
MQPSQKRILLTWDDVDRLIDSLLPKFRGEFQALLMITRGGIIPGGMLAERMGLTRLLTAAVDFPSQGEAQQTRLMAWPEFIQFPSDDSLDGLRILIIDDVWGSGRTMTAVKNRVLAARAFPDTCVLHFNPYRSLFGSLRPDYHAAVTDAYVVYPWEVDHGADKILASEMI